MVQVEGSLRIKEILYVDNFEDKAYNQSCFLIIICLAKLLEHGKQTSMGNYSVFNNTICGVMWEFGLELSQE